MGLDDKTRQAYTGKEKIHPQFMPQQLRPQSGLLTGFYTNSLWCIVRRETGAEGPWLSPGGNCGGKCNYIWLLNLPLPSPGCICCALAWENSHAKERNWNKWRCHCHQWPCAPAPHSLEKFSRHPKHSVIAVRGHRPWPNPHRPPHLSSSHRRLLSHPLVDPRDIQDRFLRSLYRISTLPLLLLLYNLSALCCNVFPGSERGCRRWSHTQVFIKVWGDEHHLARVS